MRMLILELMEGQLAVLIIFPRTMNVKVYFILKKVTISHDHFVDSCSSAQYRTLTEQLLKLLSSAQKCSSS